MHPIDVLRIQANEGQLEPVVEYIRKNYSDPNQVAILAAIIAEVSDDDYILRLYDEIENLGPVVYDNQDSKQNLVELPLEVALQRNRPKIVARICEIVFLHSIYLFRHTHWAEIVCSTKNMRIVDSYIRKRGIDFVDDPEVLEIILREDYCEFMEVCLKIKTNGGFLSSNDIKLYKPARSDEMRKLIDRFCYRTEPTKLP